MRQLEGQFGVAQVAFGGRAQQLLLAHCPHDLIDEDADGAGIVVVRIVLEADQRIGVGARARRVPVAASTSAAAWRKVGLFSVAKRWRSARV